MGRIPVFTPQDAELFLKYFTGVANALANRFELGFQPHEEHLTSLLCELLDTKGATLHSLPYTAANLNHDLARTGSLLRTTLSLETSKYTTRQETFTQADLGIILNYQDHVDQTQSFRKGLLVQAKKLYPDASGGYHLSCCYTRFDVSQYERISKLAAHYGLGPDSKRRGPGFRYDDSESAFQYLLYNPRFSHFPKHDQEKTLHSQLSRDTSDIYDYTEGLSLYDALKQPHGIKATLDISSLFLSLDMVQYLAQKAASGKKGATPTLKPFDARAVVEHVDIRAMSLPWYLVFHFLNGDAGCDLPEFLSLVSGSATPAATELQVAPPRFVFRLSVEAGTNPDSPPSESLPPTGDIPPTSLVCDD